VHALAWLTDRFDIPGAGWLEYARQEMAKARGQEISDQTANMVRVRTLKAGQIHTGTGQIINHTPGEIVLVDRDTASALCRGMDFQWADN
jgi:hypothetical protein